MTSIFHSSTEREHDAWYVVLDVSRLSFQVSCSTAHWLESLLPIEESAYLSDPILLSFVHALVSSALNLSMIVSSFSSLISSLVSSCCMLYWRPCLVEALS